jgi:hypothetical protein
MDEVDRLIRAFGDRPPAAVAAKVDVLLDLERLDDPRVVPFLLGVLADRREPGEVRGRVLRRLRNGGLAGAARPLAAAAVVRVASEDADPGLRLQAAVALGEFADLGGVLAALGGLALDAVLPIDLRYSAFTSLDRAGPTAESVALLRQLSTDEVLGRSAQGLLSAWDRSARPRPAREPACDRRDP